MPYRVAQGAGCPDGKPFAVVKETDGKRMGCHPTREAANRQLAALYAAESQLDEAQPRDRRGRFASAGAGAGPTAALDALSRGEKVDVAAGDVASIMDAAADRSDHPDLTELHVEGTPKFGLDGLGYARDQMPVLGSKHLPGFISHVQGRGVKVTRERVEPQALKPMQREVSATSSGRLYRGMRDGSLEEKQLVVSADNFVIDGHHRWGGATGLSFERPGITVPVIRIDLPGRTLRDEALAWNQTMGINPKAIGESVDDGIIAERAYVRDPRGRFAHTGGAGTGGPLLDSQQRSMTAAGTYSPAAQARHSATIAAAMEGVPAHPGSQVAYMTGGGAASGKSSKLIPALEAEGRIPAQRTNVDADKIKHSIPGYDDNVAAGKVWAARDAHEESSDVSKQMYRESLSSGRDTLYDSVGDNGAVKVSGKVAEMRANGARRVEGHYATVHPDTAVARAQARARRPGDPSYGREVPETEIRRQHADVSRTWVDLARSGTFDHLTLWDTSGGESDPARMIAEAAGGRITVHDSDAFEQFRSYAG